VLAFTKADGDGAAAAARARAEFTAALHLVRPKHPAWTAPVLTCSAHTGDGVAALWTAITDHRAAMTAAGAFTCERARQQVYWLWRAVEAGLLARFRADPAVAAAIAATEADVRAGTISPDHAAATLLAAFTRAPP
jgi:LAO/AO transport system kinase